MLRFHRIRGFLLSVALVSLTFGAGCGERENRTNGWRFGEISRCGSYALAVRTTQGDTKPDFRTYVTEIVDLKKMSLRAIDTIPSRPECVTFCDSTTVAFFKSDSTSSSLVARSFVPPKEESIFHEHLEGDSATEWVSSLDMVDEFRVWLKDSLIAYHSPSGVRIRKLLNSRESILLGELPGSLWPSISFDGREVYCVSFVEDTVGQQRTVLSVFDVESQTSRTFSVMTGYIRYQPQGLSRQSELYCLVCEPGKETCNVWACDRQDICQKLTEFEAPRAVSSFCLTRLGLVCSVAQGKTEHNGKSCIEVIPLKR